MGPGRALEDKPSARLKNIETFEVGLWINTFIPILIWWNYEGSSYKQYCSHLDPNYPQETLKTFLASNDYLRYKDLVSFHQYNTEDEVGVTMNTV